MTMGLRTDRSALGRFVPRSQRKLYAQKKASDSTLVNSQLRSRPFAPPVQAETPQAEVPDLQTQLENANRLGHSFSKMVASRTSTIQPKLTIGASGDKYEQEADSPGETLRERVAQQVVQRNAPQAGRSPAEQAVQRETVPEDEELQMSPMLQRQTNEGAVPATPELESVIQQSRGNGHPLTADLRQPLEQAFGNVDFSGVTIHTDTQSDQLNRSIQAKAFTTGQDIFFRQGAYQPENRGGQELLAHELTHVVQQNGGMVRRSPLTSQPLKNHIVAPSSTPSFSIPPISSLSINGAIGNAVNSLVFQRKFTYATGAWSSESWQGSLFPWRSKEAEQEWKALENLHGDVVSALNTLRENSNTKEQTKADDFQKEIDTLEATPIPYSKRTEVFTTLNGLKNRIDSAVITKGDRIKKEATAKQKQQEENEKKNQEEKKREDNQRLTEENRLKQKENTKQKKAEEREKQKKKKEEKEKSEQLARTQNREKHEQIEKNKQRKQETSAAKWQPAEDQWQHMLSEVTSQTEQTVATEKILNWNWRDELTNVMNDHHIKAKTRGAGEIADSMKTARQEWEKDLKEKVRRHRIDVVRQKKDYLYLYNPTLDSIVKTALADINKTHIDVTAELNTAIRDQKRTHLEKWRNYLGINAKKHIATTSTYDKQTIHISYYPDSVGSNQIVDLEGRSADEVIHQILSSVNETGRIHASVEITTLLSEHKMNEDKNVHVYWKNDNGVFPSNNLNNLPSDFNQGDAINAVTQSLIDYVNATIKPKVQQAIDKAGSPLVS
jgi:hypothetical protein